MKSAHRLLVLLLLALFADLAVSWHPHDHDDHHHDHGHHMPCPGELRHKFFDYLDSRFTTDCSLWASLFAETAHLAVHTTCNGTEDGPKPLTHYNGRKQIEEFCTGLKSVGNPVHMIAGREVYPGLAENTLVFRTDLNFGEKTMGFAGALHFAKDFEISRMDAYLAHCPAMHENGEHGISCVVNHLFGEDGEPDDDDVDEKDKEDTRHCVHMIEEHFDDEAEVEVFTRCPVHLIRLFGKEQITKGCKLFEIHFRAYHEVTSLSPVTKFSYKVGPARSASAPECPMRGSFAFWDMAIKGKHPHPHDHDHDGPNEGDVKAVNTRRLDEHMLLATGSAKMAAHVMWSNTTGKITLFHLFPMKLDTPHAQGHHDHPRAVTLLGIPIWAPAPPRETMASAGQRGWFDGGEMNNDGTPLGPSDRPPLPPLWVRGLVLLAAAAVPLLAAACMVRLCKRMAGRRAVVNEANVDRQGLLVQPAASAPSATVMV